jgi:hypothetical protein
MFEEPPRENDYDLKTSSFLFR